MEKKKAGDGTTVYSCYKISENRNEIERMFHNMKCNYKWIKCICCSSINKKKKEIKKQIAVV